LFLLKKFLIIFSIIFINGCALKSTNLVRASNINSVSIETTDNKDNILFKEHLKRLFKSKDSINQKFKLKTSISYSSSDTLSVNGLNALTRTYGLVNFKLYDFKSSKLIKSGTIKSFPILGSTSSSLYANDINLKHIKERLNISLSKKLYMHLNLALRRSK
tara:strand:- start:675 stop:1157 length:483 start_codon:yes stop_codon:yes gene_type:complete